MNIYGKLILSAGILFGGFYATGEVAEASSNTQTIQTVKGAKTMTASMYGFNEVISSTSKTTTATAVKKSNNIIGEKYIANAKKYLGVPYVFGGSTARGFDCSGFIYRVLNDSGKKVSRTSALGYYNMSKKVTTPEVGDLVFFKNTYKKGISHIAIYMGNGKVIHAAGNKVKIDSITSGYWKSKFAGYGRIK